LRRPGQKYRVFGYANDPVSGFHATAYKSAAAPYEVIIAYRGTDPGLFSGKTSAEKADHALTTVQDIAVDATMVRDTVNPQKSAADAFTAEMIAKAARQGIPMDQITVAGHSLGGTLAEIEAAKYGLQGSTYNAYGAVGLTDGPPRPGCQLTNYRMAGDVVSAANKHVGEVVSLASKDDVQSLRDGRYLDAPAGAPPPNTLIAMRLGDHGGQQHFGSQSRDNVLAPNHFKGAAQRYADNKAAFDHYSDDVFRERGELSQALRQMQEQHGQHQLPSDIQRQVNEYLALKADQSVRNAIEQSSAVQSTAHSLQVGADVARAGGHYVQTQDERAASAARAAGVHAMPLSPLAPLVGLAAGEAAHLHGQAVDVAGHFVGSQFESAKGAVEQAAHNIAHAVVEKIHAPGFQAGAANVVNRVINTYHEAQTIGQAYEAAKQSVAHGIENTERAVGHACDTLTHPGQWFHHETSAETSHASSGTGSMPSSNQAVTPAGSSFSHNDPRHPDNPLHALHQQLKERIPEAGEQRLLQFTDACHTCGIDDRNLGEIAFDRRGGHIAFHPSFIGQVAVVDIKQPSPPAAQSIRHIQQTDQQQMQINAQVQQQAQIPVPIQQGPVLGGPTMR
jgi:hypothetical protein